MLQWMAQLTNDVRFCELLEPGDLVLAYKGFLGIEMALDNSRKKSFKN